MVLSSVWWEGPTHSINTTRGGGVELTIDRRQGPILGTARVSVNVSLSTSRVGFIGGGGERMGGGGGRQNVSSSSSSWHLIQWSMQGHHIQADLCKLVRKPLPHHVV